MTFVIEFKRASITK